MSWWSAAIVCTQTHSWNKPNLKVLTLEKAPVAIPIWIQTHSILLHSLIQFSHSHFPPHYFICSYHIYHVVFIIVYLSYLWPWLITTIPLPSHSSVVPTSSYLKQKKSSCSCSSPSFTFWAKILEGWWDLTIIPEYAGEEDLVELSLHPAANISRDGFSRSKLGG